MQRKIFMAKRFFGPVMALTGAEPANFAPHYTLGLGLYFFRANGRLKSMVVPAQLSAKLTSSYKPANFFLCSIKS